jgi:hypothetical protein
LVRARRARKENHHGRLSDLAETGYLGNYRLDRALFSLGDVALISAGLTDMPVKNRHPTKLREILDSRRSGNRWSAWNNGCDSRAQMSARNSAAALAVRRDSCYDAGQTASKHFHQEEIA